MKTQHTPPAKERQRFRKVVLMTTTACLLLFCFELKNVKIVLDEQAPLGLEMDFSSAELTLLQHGGSEEAGSAEPLAIKP